MARKAKPRSSNPPQPPSPRGTSNRDKAVDAFMALLAEQSFERIGLADVASRAGLNLAQLREEFSSTLGMLAAHIKDIDRMVLSGGDADTAEESTRERLFDVLMRRIEALTPYKAAVNSLMCSARRNPGLAFALNGMAVRSQQWMLTAAGISAAGPKGMLRAQGTAMMFGRVLAVWLDDEDPGLARTMAELDRSLSRGQRWAGLLDDLCAVPARFCRRSRRRRTRDETEPAAA